jgi:hypothetical protein
LTGRQGQNRNVEKREFNTLAGTRGRPILAGARDFSGRSLIGGIPKDLTLAPVISAETSFSDRNTFHRWRSPQLLDTVVRQSIADFR